MRQPEAWSYMRKWMSWLPCLWVVNTGATGSPEGWYSAMAGSSEAAVPQEGITISRDGGMASSVAASRRRLMAAGVPTAGVPPSIVTFANHNPPVMQDVADIRRPPSAAATG